MNRILINSAAAINIAAAALIYIACSGDDGKDGSVCTGVETANGVNIVCDGNVVGTVNNGQDAPGAAGTCTILPPAADGTFSANCGGTTYPLGGAAAGGCSVNPGALGDPYYIFTCPGGTSYQVAKAICGTEPYDPQMYACELSIDQGEIVQKLSKDKCGIAVLDTNTQFCQNAASSTVKYFCGPVTNEVRTYSASQFCQPAVEGATIPNSVADADRDSTLDDVIKTLNAAITPPNPLLTVTQITGKASNSRILSRCGGKAYAEGQFCYDNSSVRLKCVNTIPQASASDPIVPTRLDSLVILGKTYEAGEICQLDGKVQANCGGKPYTPEDQFCQGGSDIQLRCSKQDVIDSIQRVDHGANLNNVKGKEYLATQFCQVKNSVQPSGLAQSASEATTGKIKTFCTTNNPTAGSKITYPEEYFCQANATTMGSDKALLCGYDTDPGASPVAVDVKDGKEYPATKFCQKGTGGSGSGVAAIGNALSGEIKDKCGPANALVTYGTDYYCGLDKSPATKIACGVTNKYDPETEFCVDDAGSDQVQSTCKPRATPAANTNNNKFATATGANSAVSAGFYDPNTKVCETRGNIIYNYIGIGGKYWTAENVRPNNVGTFTWIAAKDACPTGWELPDDGAWDALVTGADIGSAGIYLRATSGWTTNSTRPQYSIFAAVPAAVTGISPAPTGNYAFWWTSDEKGYVVDPTTGTINAGSDFNIGNYRSILEQSTALGKGGSPKMTTSLSVRCIKTGATYTPPTLPSQDQLECTNWGGGTLSGSTCTHVTATTLAACNATTPAGTFNAGANTPNRCLATATPAIADQTGCTAAVTTGATGTWTNNECRVTATSAIADQTDCAAAVETGITGTWTLAIGTCTRTIP